MFYAKLFVKHYIFNIKETIILCTNASAGAVLYNRSLSGLDEAMMTEQRRGGTIPAELQLVHFTTQRVRYEDGDTSQMPDRAGPRCYHHSVPTSCARPEDQQDSESKLQKIVCLVSSFC